jgi:hypothetical protein
LFGNIRDKLRTRFCAIGAKKMRMAQEKQQQRAMGASKNCARLIRKQNCVLGYLVIQSKLVPTATCFPFPCNYAYY